MAAIADARILVTSATVLIPETQASDIWKVWIDVPNWTQWDHNFNRTTLDSPFGLNSIITLFHKHLPAPAVLRICRVAEPSNFDTESEMPFGKVTVERTAVSEGDGVRLTHSFYLLPKNLAMQAMFNEKIAPNVVRDFDHAVNNIAGLVSAKKV
jgi:hypothetical protein